MPEFMVMVATVPHSLTPSPLSSGAPHKPVSGNPGTGFGREGTGPTVESSGPEGDGEDAPA